MAEQYMCCLKELRKYNGQKIRLPEQEIQKRLDSLRVACGRE